MPEAAGALDPPPHLVLNPHLAVGFVDGSIWLQAGSGVHVSRDPGLLHLLGAFLTPSCPDAAAASPMMDRHVAELVRIGALLPAHASTPEADEPEAEAPGVWVETFLSPIALTLDALATGLAAIGPEVEASIQRETGLGLRARLAACRAAVAGLRREVDRRAPGWVQAQIDRLDLAAEPLSLHLGCGPSELPGWLGLDIWPAQLALDLRWGLPFAAGRVARVYLAHTLEHLWYPGEVMALLREIHRVLMPGGRVRVVVPDIELALRAYVEDDREVIEGRSRTAWPDWIVTTRLESVLGYAGVGPHPGRFAEAHKFGYDFETLAHVLTQAGFHDVRRCDYQLSPDPALRIDDASAYAQAQAGGRSYSLFAEACR